MERLVAQLRDKQAGARKLAVVICKSLKELGKAASIRCVEYGHLLDASINGAFSIRLELGHD